MPSTTPERAAHWPGGDAEALAVLKAGGFIWPGGVITHPAGRDPSEREWDAVVYLFQEWDYGWDPTAPARREEGP